MNNKKLVLIIIIRIFQIKLLNNKINNNNNR